MGCDGPTGGGSGAGMGLLKLLWSYVGIPKL